MATPKRKDQKYLNPAWLRDTAALAMKRGTGIIFTATRNVYGILPGTGGSVTVFYKPDDEWIDAVLSFFPKGAVFPADCAFGGTGSARALKAYANIRLPDDGGKAWIDPVTFAVHVKGLGTTIHASALSEHDNPLLCLPSAVEPLSFKETVSPAVGKLLCECVRTEASRPALARVVGFLAGDETAIVATDGKSAVMHKCPDVPDGFNFDPKIVGLFDIAAYGAKSDKVNSTTTRTYVLDDGTTLLERTGDLSYPNYNRLLQSTAEAEHELVGSLQLGTLLDSVKEMGLGTNDSYGGVVRFSKDRTELMCGSAIVAEFDTLASFEGLNEMANIMFAVPLLRRLATLGGGMRVTANGSPAVASGGGTTVLAMPVHTPRPVSDGGAA